MSPLQRVFTIFSKIVVPLHSTSLIFIYCICYHLTLCMPLSISPTEYKFSKGGAFISFSPIPSILLALNKFLLNELTSMLCTLTRFLLFVCPGSTHSIIIHPTNYSPQKSGYHRFWLLISHWCKQFVVCLEAGTRTWARVQMKAGPPSFPILALSSSRRALIFTCVAAGPISVHLPKPRAMCTHMELGLPSREQTWGRGLKWAVRAKASKALDNWSWWSRRGDRSMSSRWHIPLLPRGKVQLEEDPLIYRAQKDGPVALV